MECVLHTRGVDESAKTGGKVGEGREFALWGVVGGSELMGKTDTADRMVL